MKKLGTVKNVIHDGTILLRALETPRPGTPVFDSRGEQVGTVARTFGSVQAPYVSVRPKGQIDSFGMLNSTLYAGEYKPARKKGVNKWQRKGKPQRK